MICGQLMGCCYDGGGDGGGGVDEGSRPAAIACARHGHRSPFPVPSLLHPQSNHVPIKTNTLVRLERVDLVLVPVLVLPLLQRPQRLRLDRTVLVSAVFVHVSSLLDYSMVTWYSVVTWHEKENENWLYTWQGGKEGVKGEKEEQKEWSGEREEVDWLEEWGDFV
mmetsp:Transcript_11881/g.37762  ORF Transcript_11881/g.37762 Transcript_11881/m.37762 type:complete len:165 (-) Transcript_11881:68-562(-)